MKDNVLYFPYISVPDSAWFTRMLLYWDKVGTITPYDFIENPEALGEHTRSLVESEMVAQVIPGLCIPDIPNFKSSFANYLHGASPDLNVRRKYFAKGETRLLHMEKMGGIEELLCELNIAQKDRYPWYTVEARTALEFMAYLAGCIGQLPEAQYDPITDAESNLSVFFESEHKRNNGGLIELNTLRTQILERVFPAPNHSLKAQEIAEFKKRHSDKLRAFRRIVEREILTIAALIDPAQRNRRVELFQDEVQELTGEIKSHLHESGVREVVFGKLCSVIGAVPGMHYVFGLANAIYEAFRKGDRTVLTSPLAYAAHAQAELLGSNNTT
jgi:hypothetical protein